MKRGVSMKALFVVMLAFSLAGNMQGGEGKEPELELAIQCPVREIKRGDEIPIVFTITNRGSSEYFYYDRVSPYNDRGGLLRQYELIAMREDGTVVGDPLKRKYSGGYGGGSPPQDGIGPGESFSRTVALNQWALIKEPGRYRVTGIYYTGIYHLSRKSPAVRSAPVEILVKPRGDEEMAVYIKELSDRLDAIEIPSTGMTRKAWSLIESTVRKLGYTCDPRIAPVLLETVYEYPHSDVWAVEAFEYYVPLDAEIRKSIFATAKERGLPGGTYSMQHLLEELGCSEEEFKQIISVCLRSAEGNIQSAGAQASQRHPDDGHTRRLIAIATDPNNKARWEATRALAYNRTDEGVKTLKALLRSPEEDIANAARWAVRSSYSDVPVYPESADDEYTSILIAAMTEANKEGWMESFLIIEMAKTRTNEGVEALKALLEEPDKEIPIAQSDEGVRALKVLLNSPDKNVRERTAGAIRWAYRAYPGRPLREDDFPEPYRESLENRKKSTLEWLQKSKDSETNAAGATKRQWARRVKLAGVGNFHKVSDVLYRGAQPSEKGMKELEKMGIKTIVNLRSFHSDRDEMKGTKMGYEHITMKAWHAEEKELVRFLKIVSDKERQPVFVHCQYGSDRTGTMCAAYRIAVQGWTKEEAIEEMTQGDFGFHGVWSNLVEYIRKLDVEKIRKKAGLAQ